MIAATLAGFAIAVFILAGIGAIVRWSDRKAQRRLNVDALRTALADDRRLAAGVVAQAISEAVHAGKHPIGYRILSHPSGDVVDVLCAEDAAENAEQILREGE